MIVSRELSTRIAQLIAEYSAQGESVSPELGKLVAQERVLPLFSDMGGVFTINPEGEVFSFPWDDLLHGRRLESDRRIRNVVLFQGSKKYPELKVLIEKPNDVHVCEYCQGTGIAPYAEKLNTDGIVCYCGGLGWIP